MTLIHVSIHASGYVLVSQYIGARPSGKRLSAGVSGT